MRNIIITFLLLLNFPNIFVFGQNNQDSIKNEISYLKNIYNNLEYDTRGFDDVKEKWIVSDKNLVRTLFNQFIVNKLYPSKDIFLFNRNISDGNIYLKITKRYFDDELEKIEFKTYKHTSVVLPKKIDGFFLRVLVGSDVYKKIKDKSYHTIITKKEFQKPSIYNYDILLSTLEPEVMFWQATTSNINDQIQNKYLLSFFGKWGNDNLMIPGWFASDYIGGLKLTYKKDILKRNSIYSLAIGTNFKSGDPFPNIMPSKPIFFSGRSIYFDFWGNLKKDLNLNIEGKFRIQEYTRQKYHYISQRHRVFYTVKNYMVLNLEINKLTSIPLPGGATFGTLNATVGFSFFDLEHLQFIPTEINIIHLDNVDENIFKRIQKNFNIDFSIKSPEGFFKYQINPLFINYNLGNKYGYLGIKLKALLNDTFGIDVRFFRKFSGNIPAWRNNYYIVFSPILRINY